MSALGLRCREQRRWREFRKATLTGPRRSAQHCRIVSTLPGKVASLDLQLGNMGYCMGNRRWRVRRSAGHSDRLIALPDDGSPSHDRRDPDYDGYVRAESQSSEPAPKMLPEVVVNPAERRACPVCGRNVRFNLGRGYYYSHTLPGSAVTCSQSGRP